MKITGFQKLSLVDFDGHMTCTLFTSGCNLLCPFCHNALLVYGKEPKINKSEIFDYLIKRKGIIDSVCVTGGEPTLQPDLPEFIKELKKLGFLVKLDTNGTNPEMLKQLCNENLIDYIAMDIKNSFEKYDLTAGKSTDLNRIKESIDFIINCGIDFEFRTTIIKDFHTENDIKKIANMVKGAKRFYLQKYKDSGNCIKSGFEPIDKTTATKFQEILNRSIPQVELRGY